MLETMRRDVQEEMHGIREVPSDEHLRNIFPILQKASIRIDHCDFHAQADSLQGDPYSEQCQH